MFLMKFESYATIRWTPDKRAMPGHQALRDHKAFKYARDGLCREFHQHLDMTHFARPVYNLDELDAEITNWQRNTLIGREHTKA